MLTTCEIVPLNFRRCFRKIQNLLSPSHCQHQDKYKLSSPIKFVVKFTFVRTHSFNWTMQSVSVIITCPLNQHIYNSPP